MAGVNFAVLVGHVGQDPEIKQTQGGGKVARFSLASSESWKDRVTGEVKDRTEWHTVIAFSDGLVQVIERYVRKGSQLYVRGQIRTRKWQDKDGNDRWSTEIHLSGFDAALQMLGKREGGRAPLPEDDGYAGARDSGKGGGGSVDDLDDDVPF